MKHPNLTRRGHLFWWRRKITLHGTTIQLGLPLGTANFYHARGIAERLGGALEELRLAYGQRGSSIDAVTLKRIFQDAMRWQLDRILQSQIGSIEPVAAHRQTNRIYAELWRHRANHGPDARWPHDDQQRLIRSGWSDADVELLLEEVDRHSGPLVSLRQLQSYAEHFGFELSPVNHARVQQVVFSARAAACDAANDHLGTEPGDLGQWAKDALAAHDPLIFEACVTHKAEAAEATPPPSAKSADVLPPPVQLAPNVEAEHSKLLTESMEECVAAFQSEQAWSRNSIEQVRTAIRLFDFACGRNVTIQGITKDHVERFRELCEALPNRWGRTTEEQAGGLSASLARAKNMNSSMLGMSQKTRNKHLTWITSVLAFAATDRGGNHEPADATGVEKAIRELRRGIGKKAGKSDRKRARDLRAAWSRDEIARLFAAPIWTGCRSLDRRFEPGREIYHDAWYWLPLMMALYGGRSSELVGLPVADTYERASIPFFRIDYTDLRPLKNVQSVRSLPIHPELVRLGFIEYVAAVRAAGHTLLFPEMHSAGSKSFASTFYKSVFTRWRDWAFPEGTDWRHQVRGAMKDKDVHSFRGAASTIMKGKVPDSVRFDILGHEGANETTRTYDEEAPLEDKLDALMLLSPLTSHITVVPLRLRPEDRQKFGRRSGRSPQRPKA
ncbi:hypothetical protein [uncultured Sphingomonas sp.]|uniref:hypothetical protein n=1 Tax=uncultured Sphingomonas sp. TaxID=158754 RepID=UPI0025FCC320|nr:hypothetical protein [uncultured Sphingomonas sp.]